MSYFKDPSFESGSGWTFGTDCNVAGAAIVASNPRTGTKALRIRSRTVGPTCGFADGLLEGLTPGNSYRLAIYWDAQGVSTDKDAEITMDGFAMGSISGTTPAAGQYERWVSPVVFVASAPTATIRIRQLAGATGNLDRFFDDLELLDVVGGIEADPSSVSNEAGVSSLSNTAQLSGLSSRAKPGFGG